MAGILIRQISGVPPAARLVSGGLPVRYLVSIRNNAAEPITLERVGLDSMGSGAYTINHSSAFKDVVIAPAQTREIDFWASAQANETVSGANGPVTLRVVLYFDAPSGKFEDVTVQNVAAGAR